MAQLLYQWLNAAAAAKAYVETATPNFRNGKQGWSAAECTPRTLGPLGACTVGTAVGMGMGCGLECWLD